MRDIFVREIHDMWLTSCPSSAGKFDRNEP